MGKKKKPIIPLSTSDGWGGDPIEVEHIASFYHSDPIESKTILDWDEAQEDKETISGSLIEPIKIGDEKDGWKQFVSLCVAYRKEFGRAPTFIAIYRGKPLGQWCEAAQKAHKTNRLTPTQRIELKTALPKIISDEEVWDAWLELYIDYIQKHRCEPDPCLTYCGVQLGHWCHLQVKYHSTSRLPQNRVNQLKEIGFPFPARRSEIWAYWLDLYCAYKNEYGKEPSTRTVYRGENLGCWVSAQRNKYNKGALSKARKDALLEVGFPFNQRIPTREESRRADCNAIEPVF